MTNENNSTKKSANNVIDITKSKLVADITQLAFELNFETELNVCVVLNGQTGTLTVTINEWKNEDDFIEIARSVIDLIQPNLTKESVNVFENNLVLKLLNTRTALKVFIERRAVDPTYLNDDLTF